jgi:DNA (cytosine-5)-methyltransferase 1
VALNLIINEVAMVVDLKHGAWKLSELKDVPKNGLKVFSCFHCGGGSTMGYKLAGYEVLGGVEIDPEMMDLYRKNHKPKHSFLMGVQEFKSIPNDKLPQELFELDILDGSPPCSSFSVSGNREKNWGEKKKFREGQTEQILDDLFFDYINIAKKLQPKIVLAENVKGLIIGNAKGYVKQIFAAFKEAGYEVQLFLLNAAAMGVPQRRERTFFIARRKDLNLPKISLSFNEKEIALKNAFNGLDNQSNEGKILTEETRLLWEKIQPGEPLSKAHPKGSRFNEYKCNPNKSSNTLPSSSGGAPMHWSEPRRLSILEYCRIQTFPDDYYFGKFQDNYVCGMSVPPFMIQRIAREIEIQWFKA